MPRRLFSQQNTESERAQQRELNLIMEAHLGPGAATAEKSRTDMAEGFGEGGQGDGQTSCAEDGEMRRHVSAFTAKMIESSRQTSGKSMLYHGKL